MIQAIDVEKRLHEIRKVKTVAFLVFAFFSIVCFASLIFLLVLSNEKYTLNIVFATLISFVLISFYLVFFLYFFPPVNNSFNFLKNVRLGNKETGHFELESIKEKKLVRTNNMIPVDVKYKFEGRDLVRTIYCLEGTNLNLQIGSKFKAVIYQNVLLSYEVEQ